MPLRAAVPLSSAVCNAGGACLPLTTTAPISDGAARDDGAWIRLSAAALPAMEGCDADGACVPLSATVPLASGVCEAGGARVSVSAAVLLITGDCPGDPAGAAPSAVVPTDGTCEPAVTGAWISAVDECVASHAHNAMPQTPTVATTPIATAAVRNLMGRRCVFRAARRGPNATASAFMA